MLREGKTVYMAVPKFAQQHPFYLLDPAALAVSPEEAASCRTAATVARHVDLDDVEPIDLIVCDSVAVNCHGARLGKGASYSDIEVALLQEPGLIGPATPIVTTVHSLPVVDDELQETEHDFRVDVIVTPDKVIPCSSPKRLTGFLGAPEPGQGRRHPVLAARAQKQVKNEP